MTEAPPAPRALVGPTASGKTEASLVVAEALDAEIVSVDALVVYRGMDVGTAKPTLDQLARVPHHLVNVVEPGEAFSVSRYQGLAGQAMAGIRGRGRVPFLVGGSGLYYRAVVDGLAFPGTDPSVRADLEAEAKALGPAALHDRLRGVDPVAAARIDPANVRRTVRALEVAAVTGRPFSTFAGDWDRHPALAVRAAGVDIPRAVLIRRIEGRVRGMMIGLLAETRALIDRGQGPFLTSSQVIGYAEAVACHEGRMDRTEAETVIVRRTKALARRQMAWFRRDPRIRWFPVGEGGAVDAVDDILAHLREA